jgi:branched-chain amino acid transport system substrate-binding protein
VLGSFGVASGVVGSVFDAVPTASRAWVSHINSKGGLNGHPVRLILADDGGDSARTQQIVRRMVEQDKVVAFFGEFSGTTAGVLPYLEEKGIPVIGSYGADGAAEGSPMYFNPGHGPRLGKSWGFLSTIGTYTEKKKLGILYCREVQECSVQVSNFKKLLPYEGIELVYESQVSLAQPDYTGEMLAAQRAGAEVLAVLVDWSTVARMKRSAERQSYDPVFAGMHQLHDQDVMPFAKDVEGTITYGQTANWQTSPKMAEYRDAVARYQPNKPLGDSGALIWASGRLLAEKVAPHLQEPATSAQILSGLRSIQNETLDGLLPGINWSQGADKGVHYCVVPAKFTGGKFVTHDAAESFICPKQGGGA